MSTAAEVPGVRDLMAMGMVSDAAGAIVAPAVRDLVVLEGQLTAWLRDRMPAARDLRLVGLTYPRGSGQSHETILFDALWTEDGVSRSEGLVARIKPSSFALFSDDMFLEEYQLMRVLGDSGKVPVAPVRWYEQDPAVIGSPFFIMAKLSGRVAVSIPSYLDSGWVAEASSIQRATLWESCVRSLAAIQSIPVTEAPFLALPSGGTGFEQEWDRWERTLRRIETPERPLPAFRDLSRRLVETMPDHRPEGIVWGDARLGNVMVGEDFRVQALMDWEQPSLGGALHDLGWWLISQRGKIDDRGGETLPGVLDRHETIALWGDVTGISVESIDWYEAFAAFKMSCLMVSMLDLRGQKPPSGDWGALFHIRAARELLEG